jgi:putative ABC transport system permease protein
MKTIEISEQPILSFRRTVKITANGIRYRLFRSLVTVVVVAVAVAFLMNILSESLIRRAIERRTTRRIAELRCAATWVGCLTDPGTVEELLQRLGRASPTEPICREAETMLGLSEADAAACRQDARTAAEHLTFFADLDYARRRALVHTATGIGIFDGLQDDAALIRLRGALKTMRALRLPSPLQEFEEFLGRWPALKEQTLRFRKRREWAVAAVAEHLSGRPMIQALAEADGSFGEAVRAAGFALDPPAAAAVAEQARRTLDVLRIEATLANPDTCKAIAGYLDLMPTDVNARTLWRLLRERRGASWYLAKQRELGGEAAGFAVERLVELGRTEAELAALTRAERKGAGSGGLLGERMGWLVFASMLVCIVGISNSMLMSVTERFREIATLKCLGALDGFILLMFVLEAVSLGSVGAVAGALLGTLLGLGRMALAFGSLALPAVPVAELLAAMAVSVVLGVLLAAVASVYPSLKAARLAPMEAMRIQ